MARRQARRTFEGRAAEAHFDDVRPAQIELRQIRQHFVERAAFSPAWPWLYWKLINRMPLPAGVQAPLNEWLR